MIKFRIILFWALSGVLRLSGQADSDELFKKNMFAAALPHYLGQLKSDSLNPGLNYRVGICYLNSKSQKKKALFYLEKVLASGASGNLLMNTHKFLADACFINHKFGRAADHYEKYKNLALQAGYNYLPEQEEIQWKTKICRLGLMLDARTDTAIKYTLTLQPDQSVNFFFQHPSGQKINALNPDDYFRRFVSFVTADSLSPAERKKDSVQNAATAATSTDGQIILIYKNDKGQGCLYESSLNGNHWTAPEKISHACNREGWEPGECISADGNLLYFTSDEAGGFGGKDIYVRKKAPDGGWGEAINLGSGLNTPYDEEAPFIYPDGKNLLFSSNRPGAGNISDIFLSSLMNDGSWSEPVSTGYPLKDTSVYYIAGKTNLSSGTDPERKNNYLISFFDQGILALVLLKGEVILPDGREDAITEIKLCDNITGKINGVFYPGNTGRYMIILPDGRNNNITYQAEGYLPYSENLDISENNDFYRIRKPVSLTPVRAGSKTVLNNIFFEPGKAMLLPSSVADLNTLYQFMNKNPNITIELYAYAGTGENGLLNHGLSRERGLAIVKYLIYRGIDSKKLTIKEQEPESPAEKEKTKVNTIKHTQQQNNKGLEVKILTF